MSNDQPSRRGPGKSSGGAPMGSTVSIVIAVIAVVVGFLVLRNINDSDGGDSSGDGGTEQTTATTPGDGTTGVVDESSTSAPDTTVATTVFDFDATQQVVVANAAGIGGTAGRYSQTLGTVGWTMGEPVTATQQLDVSVVYYLAGGENVAASVAQAMSGPDGTIATAAMPTPVPIEGGVLPAGATVLVMLGTDRAEKALPAVAGTTTNTTIVQAPVDQTTTTVAG